MRKKSKRNYWFPKTQFMWLKSILENKKKTANTTMLKVGQKILMRVKPTRKEISWTNMPREWGKMWITKVHFEMIERNQKCLLIQVLCTLIYPGSFDDQQQPQHQQQPHQDRRKHKHHNSHNNYNHRKHEPSTFTHNLPHNDFLTSKHRSRNTFGRRIMSIIELPLY